MPRKCRGPVAAGYQHLPGLWPPEPQAAEAAVSGPGTSAAAPGRYSARPPERPERTILNLLDEENAEGGEHIRTAGARCWRGPAPTGVAEQKAVKDADIVDVRSAGGGQASSDAAAG